MSAPPADQEIVDKAATMHVVRAAFPESHLAPWMSVHDKQTIAVLAGLYTVADMSEELDKRKWLDDQAAKQPELEDAKTWEEVRNLWQEKHPGEILPAFMQPKPKEEEDEDEEEEFDDTIIRGGPAMIGVFLRSLAQHTHDLAPSRDGLRTRQAIGLGGAVKSNIAIQPTPKPTFWQRIRGKGGASQQVSGGT